MDPAYKRYFKTVALIWGFCLAVLALVYVFVVMPQEETINKIEGQLAGGKIEYHIFKNAASTKAKTELTSQINELKSQLSDFVTEFDDISGVIFGIGQVVNGMNVGSFASRGGTVESSVEIPNCEHLGQIFFRMEFTASFNLFAQVINTLERHKPIVFVNKFSIAQSSRNNNAHKVGLTLSIFTRESHKDNRKSAPVSYDDGELPDLSFAEESGFVR